MSYEIVYSKQASDFIEKADKPLQIELLKKISKLAENPEIGDFLRYDLKKFRKLRAGKFRILYEMKKEEIIVLIVKIEHRKTVYS